MLPSKLESISKVTTTSITQDTFATRCVFIHFIGSNHRLIKACLQDLFSNDKTMNRELEDHLEAIACFLQENRSVGVNSFVVFGTVRKHLASGNALIAIDKAIYLTTFQVNVIACCPYTYFE